MVSSEVSKPLIISTKVITGTGFMKWIPITLLGRLTNRASLVIEIEEVLEARIPSGARTSSKVSKIFLLMSKFSVTAYKLANTTESRSGEPQWPLRNHGGPQASG